MPSLSSPPCSLVVLGYSLFLHSISPLPGWTLHVPVSPRDALALASGGHSPQGWPSLHSGAETIPQGHSWRAAQALPSTPADPAPKPTNFGPIYYIASRFFSFNRVLCFLVILPKLTETVYIYIYIRETPRANCALQVLKLKHIKDTERGNWRKSSREVTRSSSLNLLISAVSLQWT